MSKTIKDESTKQMKKWSVSLIVLITAMILSITAVVCLLTSDLLLGTKHLMPEQTYIAREGSFLATAKSRVPIGSSREDALQALSDAWFHSECRNPNGTRVMEDLFFYGSHSPDDASIIHVMYTTDANGNTSVDFVGQLENYMLHLYEHCTPPPYEAFDDAPTGEPNDE